MKLECVDRNVLYRMNNNQKHETVIYLQNIDKYNNISNNCELKCVCLFFILYEYIMINPTDNCLPNIQGTWIFLTDLNGECTVRIEPGDQVNQYKLIILDPLHTDDIKLRGVVTPMGIDMCNVVFTGKASVEVKSHFIQLYLKKDEKVCKMSGFSILYPEQDICQINAYKQHN